jgi:FdhE protein
MDQIFSHTANIADIIDDTIGRNPHSGDILKAFKPIIVAQRRLIEQISLKNIDVQGIDEQKFRQGVAVIRQIVLIAPDDPWNQIAEALLPAIAEGFPALKGDMEKMGKRLKAGEIKIYDYFGAAPNEGETVADGWSSAFQISETAIYLFLMAATRIIMEKRAGALGGAIKNLKWDKGCCPVCGTHPVIAWIEEKGSRRWLHCGQCGTNWVFSRVICPYCENEAQQGMDYFYVENRPQESAFTCDQCKRYLITLNRISDLNDQDLDVTAISLAYLDMIMQDKDFTPMTACLWNSF